MNLELLNQSLLALNPSKNNSIEQDKHFLDVVFLGDSITEHWNGRDMGVFREKDYNVSLVFQKFFQKKNGSSVEGLALGVAGDRVSLATKKRCKHCPKNCESSFH